VATKHAAPLVHSFSRSLRSQVTASIDVWSEDDAMKGKLGVQVPIDYPCVAVIEDILADASSLADITQADAESIVGDLGSRRLASSTSTDLDMIKMAIAAYDLQTCGAAPGWYPWFNVQKDNAYAQVCWTPSNQCTIAVRGSDDSVDWFNNIVTNVLTGTVGGYNVPLGFVTEYNKLKASDMWAVWEWARNSEHCAGGVHVTGHSLGGALAR